MNKTTYYINGNAVRELDEAAPVRRPQKLSLITHLRAHET